MVTITTSPARITQVIFDAYSIGLRYQDYTVTCDEAITQFCWRIGPQYAWAFYFDKSSIEYADPRDVLNALIMKWREAEQYFSQLTLDEPVQYPSSSNCGRVPRHVNPKVSADIPNTTTNEK
jgi:hypothetical protein